MKASKSPLLLPLIACLLNTSPIRAEENGCVVSANFRVCSVLTSGLLLASSANFQIRAAGAEAPATDEASGSRSAQESRPLVQAWSGDGRVHVRVDLEQAGAQPRIRLFDVQGRVVAEADAGAGDSKTAELQLQAPGGSAFSPGVYFLVVRSLSGSTPRRVVIVR